VRASPAFHSGWVGAAWRKRQAAFFLPLSAASGVRLGRRIRSGKGIRTGKDHGNAGHLVHGLDALMSRARGRRKDAMADHHEGQAGKDSDQYPVQLFFPHVPFSA